MDKETARAALNEVLAEQRAYLAKAEELAPVIRWLQGKVGASVEPPKLPTVARTLFEADEPAKPIDDLIPRNGDGLGPLAGMPMKKALGFVIAAMDGVKSTVDLQKALLANGFTSDAKALHNGIYGTLNRFRKEGHVERAAPGRWRRTATSTLPSLGLPLAL